MPRSEFAAMPRLADVGSTDSGESAQSDEKSMSKSSDDEPLDAHVLGDETMVDNGIADADARDSIINVALAEGQRAHYACTSTGMLKKWRTRTFSVVVLGRLTSIRINNFAV
jgi:hypothetical protein